VTAPGQPGRRAQIPALRAWFEAALGLAYRGDWPARA
jgi:hypothetical protein